MSRHLDDSQPFVNLQKAEPVHVGTKAAEMVNVSPRSVEMASKVIKYGAPELVRAVEHGEPRRSVLQVAQRVLDNPLENGGVDSELFAWAVETLR